MSVLKHIPFSLLELAAVPEQVSVSATLSSMLDYAQRADELGFNRFWLAEHHNMPGIASSATAVLIGQVAARTQNIRVGSGGIGRGVTDAGRVAVAAAAARDHAAAIAE